MGVPPLVPGGLPPERALFSGAQGAGVHADVGVRRQGRTNARARLLGISQDEFSRAFKGSPMKRAKLRGLKRNAAVVLGNVGMAVHVLARALQNSEPPAQPVCNEQTTDPGTDEDEGPISHRARAARFRGVTRSEPQ